MLLVSLIVPTYNCESLLRQCLDSLVAQDYPNLEIVVIDGGSLDGTVALAKAYGDRIAKIVSEPDRGIYDAMNKGIDASTGEWLYFIGADDALADPGVVSAMMGDVAAQDDTTLMLYGDVNNATMGSRYRGETAFPEIIDFNVCHQAVFYRRRLFEIEAPYNLRYRLYADWDLNLRIYLRHPGSHRYVDRLVANYCSGGTSWAKRDEAFDRDLERNLWNYADGCRPASAARRLRARLYARAIRKARERGDQREAFRLAAASLRHSSILRFAMGKAFGKG